tara:strand:+ start:78 stop:779 length:702 start_codon:yes stop_codon:yes gene_type:complete
MPKKDKIIALIPARKGSKEIKNKNLLKINKKTLIELTIDNAKRSKYIDQIYLSSDSNKILKISNLFKNVLTHKRIKSSSNDKSTSKDVLKDFLSKNKKYVSQGIILVYLQPTSPMRNHHHIDNAIKLFKIKKKDTLISCYEILESEKIFKSFILDKNKNFISLFKKKNIYANRQSFPKILTPNGAIFIFKINKNFIKEFSNLKNVTTYIMEKKDAIDINTMQDYLEAKKNLLR